MVEIELKYNFGYKWYENDGIYVKGYLFDKDDRLYKDNELIKYFKNIKDQNDFKNRLIEANGIFSVIIHKNEKVYMAVDRTRTFPIFYVNIGDNLYISDNNFYLKDRLNLKISELSKNELLGFGYVSGFETIFQEVFQIQAGQLISFIDNHLNYSQYNNFILDINPNIKEEKIFSELNEITLKIFNRLIQYANGRTLLIPLSGGYDSRYIIAMLSKLQYSKIIAFTYGKENSHEVIISKKIAKILNIKHYFIEYKNIWSNIFTNELKEYFKYSFNGVSLTHIQDIYAIKYLHEKKLIPQDTVVIPGHSGDLIGGSHIRTEYDILKKESKFLDIREIIYLKNFKSVNNNIKSEIFDKLAIQLNKNKGYNSYSLSENWNIKNRQSKYIINSCRIYEYYNYQYLLPLWDKELVEYYLSLPLKYRVENVIYNQYLEQEIFIPLNINFLKKEALYRNKYIKRIKSILPNFISLALKNVYIVLKKKKDNVNDFNAIDKILLEQLENKNVEYSDFKELLGIWLLEKLEIKGSK